MTNKTSTRHPKTHSDVLWHFTGGALWNKKSQKQSAKPKSITKAFNAFIEILKSRTLRLGGYHEIIKCTVPSDRIYNENTNKMDTIRNSARIISTSPVCCVADIPLTELFHHAKRYGKIAIGFKRNGLIKAGFNPVLYTLHNTQIILNFYNAQNTLRISDCGIDDAISDIENSISEIECDHFHNDENYCAHDIDTSPLSSVADEVSSIMQEALTDLENNLAFIKTFDKSEFDTIYSEREWRSISPLKFNWNDVSALIIPKKNGYHQKFIQHFQSKLKLPSTIKIYCWEDINKI